tara:strand:+ start:649 stop:1038 length:390 start_codon:yes stop_codon:yes gene_type:complete
MSENGQALLQQDPEKTARVALSVFFNIVSAWHVRPNEQMVLLGMPAETTFNEWEKGQASNLSVDTLERISYIIRIYKVLGILFPSREQADAWPQKPNKNFNHESALKYMLNGSVIHLRDICRYLDSQRG